LDASSGAEAVQPTKSQKENSVWGPQGISPETPGVARIKIARSTLAPHLGMTLYASRAEQEKQIYFEIEWTRVSFIDVKFFLIESIL
jgi:hypothetical protein